MIRLSKLGTRERLAVIERKQKMIIERTKTDNIFFTGDYHIDHAKILEYCKRPFKSIKEMNETILENFNETIDRNDVVFFLGDVAFGCNSTKKTLQLMRKKAMVHFIMGNHDMKYHRTICQIANTTNNLLDIVVDDQPITLCHYAMRIWNKSHFNSFQLYGHSHGRLMPIGKQWDVGVDNNNFKPISFEEIKNIMSKQPNNSNYIDKSR